MTESDEDIQQLSWQVLDIILDKLRGLIGERAIGLLHTVQDADRTHPPSPRLVYDIGNELEEVVGKKGAFALLRVIGREIGVMFTEGKDTKIATEILTVTLRNLGFAYEIKLEDKDAYICHCVFYDILNADGHGPIEKPVCWTGWGFIEGCLSNINGAHHIKWMERDIDAKACRFDVRLSANEWEWEED